MKRSRLSLIYLFSYLVGAGFALIFVPKFSMDLLFSNEDYGPELPRLLGVVLLALGILIFQIWRHGLDEMYTATIVARAAILAVLAYLFVSSGNPFFAVLILVVGFGFALTAVSWWRDRQDAVGTAGARTAKAARS